MQIPADACAEWAVPTPPCHLLLRLSRGGPAPYAGGTGPSHEGGRRLPGRASEGPLRGGGRAAQALLQAEPHSPVELRERLCGDDDGDAVLAGHLRNTPPLAAAPDTSGTMSLQALRL